MIDKTQWYEVLRHDGRIQYATKYKDSYFIGGSGFGYGNLDAVSITAMEGCPPSIDIHTYVCFDGDENNIFRAIVDKNYRWNGWECPFIHVDDAFRMMEYITRDGDWLSYSIDGENIIIKDPEADGYCSVIEPTIKDGEKYYYFGNEGWVFEIAQLEYNDESESEY
jgi:hypothetical protein